MGLLTFAGRIVLVVLNIIFILFSLALVCGGFILRFGQEILRSRLKGVLDSVESSVKNLDPDSNFSTDSMDLGSLLDGLATAMIVVGLALLALSFVGCCGACCSCTTLMLVYSIILIVILFTQIILVIITWGSPDTIKDNISPSLKSSLDEYQGLNGTTIVSLGWNWMMAECCGVDNYKDFTGKKEWWGDSTMHTPIACCKNLPSNTAEKDACAGNKQSQPDITAIASKSNKDTGCLDAVWEKIVEMNQAYLLFGIGICFACQIVLIIFAFLVYKDRGIKGGLV